MKKKKLAIASLLMALLMPLAVYAEGDDTLSTNGEAPVETYAATDATDETEPIKWDVSRSKTATALDENYVSTVTLSLPSAEETLASDVVFVIDKSECGGEAAEAAKELVSQLLAQKELENAKLNVGVVAFSGTAKVTRELSNVTTADELENAFSKDAAAGLHGSNIQSGLIEADKMLSADTDVSDSRKYVVLVSDGHTYQFSKENEYSDYVDGDAHFNALTTYGIYNEGDMYAYAYGITYTIHNMFDQYYTDNYNEDGSYKGNWTGSYLTDSTYKKDDGSVYNVYELPYGSWDKYWKHITEVVNNDNGKYDVELAYDDTGYYGNLYIGKDLSQEERAAKADEILGPDKYIKCGLDENGNDNQLMHASGIDRSVYEAYNKYASMAKKYHCYPIYVSHDDWDSAKTTQDYGYQLMNALGDISNNTGTDVNTPNASVTIPDITNIFKSIKNDILYAVGAGSAVEDVIGNDFTLDANSISIRIGDGDNVLTKRALGENSWQFGDDENAKDRFVVSYDSAAKKITWNINQPITNFARVQLSYNVKLTNLSTDPGSHKSFTNEKATLHPVDSNGTPGPDVQFPRPEVSYMIYALNYDANGGSGAPDAEVNCSGKFTVSDTAPTQDGYKFVGWNTAADGSGTNYTAGSEVELTKKVPSLILYAQWNKLVTVSFDLCGHGGTIASQTFVSGGKASEPTAPKEDGWVFGGWYIEKNCQHRFNFDSTVNSDIVLYAKWDRVAVTAPSATATPAPTAAPAVTPAPSAKAAAVKGTIPQTRDVFPLEGLVALFVIGVAGVGTVWFLRKKRR